MRKNVASYTLKMLIPYAILFGISLVSYRFIPFIVIISCIVLCVPNALTIMYLTVINKTSIAHHYQNGGYHARLNNGKVFCITIAFFISLFSTFALFLETPTWKIYEWLAFLFLLPVYGIIFNVVRSFLKKEVKGFYLESLNLKWCIVIVPIIMCMLYFACDYLFIPKIEYQSIANAFSDQKNILDSSPSALVSDAAKLTALVNAFYSYVIGRVSPSFPLISVIWKVIIYWAMFCNITNIINCFMIPKTQLKRIFIPLTRDEIPDPNLPVQKKYIALSIALVVIIITSFLKLDSYTARINSSHGYFTRIEAFIREKIEVLAVAIDDQYYQYQPTIELIRQLDLETSNLQETVKREIVPLINRAFDKRLANVDVYLDWYYSLPADYQRLGRMITGTIEDYLADKTLEYINAGVNDAEWMEKADYYSRLTEELYSKHLQELQKLKIDHIPQWLIQPIERISMADFTRPLDSTREMVSFRVRLGISAGVGITAGIITRVLVTKLAQKQIIQKMTAKLLAKVGTSIASKVATGAGVGAAGGAVAGPIGVAIGALVGVGVAIATDYAFLKIEEAMERDNLHSELVQTIEQQRQDALGLL